MSREPIVAPLNDCPVAWRQARRATPDTLFALLAVERSLLVVDGVAERCWMIDLLRRRPWEFSMARAERVLALGDLMGRIIEREDEFGDPIVVLSPQLLSDVA